MRALRYLFEQAILIGILLTPWGVGYLVPIVQPIVMRYLSQGE